ncbi:MAG: B12-binding domain-containing radical SAM protein [Candidatus Helarchaeota archaeon]
MRILIIDALGSESGSRRFTRDVISAGPRTIAGILQKFSIKARILTAEEFLKTDKSMISADYLFVSAMSMDFEAVQRVLLKWAKLPRINHETALKILGGPITAARDAIIKKLDFDIGVQGEAEDTLTSLITPIFLSKEPNFALLKSIPGIMFRSPEGIIINPKHSYISKDCLNSFQPSAKRVKDYRFYKAARIYIECVRGCSNFFRTKIQLPNGRMCNDCKTCTAADLNQRIVCPLSIPPGCGYCSVPALYGPPRSRNLASILAEIEELIELGALRLILGASDFLEYQRENLVAPAPLTDPISPPPNYPQIEQLLMQVAELIRGTDVHIFIENIKASLFTDQAASLIAQYLPNTSLSIGCETGSKIHARLLGRASTPQEVVQAVQLAKKHKIRVHTYFIHGLPGQTLQSAISTKRVMTKLSTEGVDKITVYRFKPLPMSAFEDFPTPPAASQDKASKIIADTAIQINYKNKETYLGTTERVIVSELSKNDSTKAIGYPLRGGPTIEIENATHLLNQLITVKVYKVLSDKLLAGSVVK